MSGRHDRDDRAADAEGERSPDRDASSAAGTGQRPAGENRQRVERVRGSRRARLTPAPGSDPSPEAPAHRDEPPAGEPGSPDDERITRERPPHW